MLMVLYKSSSPTPSAQPNVTVVKKKVVPFPSARKGCLCAGSVFNMGSSEANLDVFQPQSTQGLCSQVLDVWAFTVKRDFMMVFVHKHP